MKKIYYYLGVVVFVLGGYFYFHSNLMFRENVYGHPILDQPEFLELRWRLGNRG